MVQSGPLANQGKSHDALRACPDPWQVDSEANHDRGTEDGSGFTYFDTAARAGVILEIRQSPPA